MYNIYDDWIILFLIDFLPIMTFLIFIIGLIVIKLSGEFDE
jgi:hypothetical protein